MLQIDAEDKAVHLARILGCPSLKSEDLLKTLMNADAKEMTRLANRTLSADEKRRGLPMPFRPVIEPTNEGAFISEHPLKLMKQKDVFGGIPIIIGAVNNEGMINLKDALIKVKHFNSDVVKYIPRYSTVRLVCKRNG